MLGGPAVSFKSTGCATLISHGSLRVEFIHVSEPTHPEKIGKPTERRTNWPDLVTGWLSWLFSEFMSEWSQLSWARPQGTVAYNPSLTLPRVNSSPENKHGPGSKGTLKDSFSTNYSSFQGSCHAVTIASDMRPLP